MIVIMSIVIVFLWNFTKILQFSILFFKPWKLILVLFYYLIKTNLWLRIRITLIFMKSFVRLKFLLILWNAHWFTSNWRKINLRFLKIWWLHFDTFSYSIDLLSQIFVLHLKKISLFYKSIYHLIFLIHLNSWFIFDIHCASCIIQSR